MKPNAIFQDHSRALWFGLAAIAIVIAFCCVRGCSYTNALRTLRPEEVTKVRLQMQKWEGKKKWQQDNILTKERFLKREDISNLLALISGSRSPSFGSHPVLFDWSCDVEIYTVASAPRFSFRIHAPAGGGAVIVLDRNWSSAPNLQNDALRSFVESQFEDTPWSIAPDGSPDRLSR